MSDLDKFREVLSQVELSDVSLDADGRVVVDNPDVLKMIQALGAGLIERVASADDNFGCCKNGIGCNRVEPAEIAEIRQRFVSLGKR